MSGGLAHEMSLSMVRAPVAELEAGTDIPLQVQVSCSSGCNLHGGKIMIVNHEGAATEDIELTSLDDVASMTEELILLAPDEPGEYTWTAVFPAQEHAGVLHGESVVSFSFAVKSHTLSITTFEVPSEIRTNARFGVKVAVKCSAGCKLAGREVDIYDHNGAKVRIAILGDVVQPEHGAQYYAEVKLDAPGIEGDYTWTIKVPESDSELVHRESLHTFNFRTVSPPEHVVTIEVTGRDTKAPVKNALIIIRPLLYRGITYTDYTDETGVARTRVPEDEYMIVASSDGYRSFSARFNLTDDVAFKTELWVGTDVHDLNGQPLQEA